jgi:hypothetical protein
MATACEGWLPLPGAGTAATAGSGDAWVCVEGRRRESREGRVVVVVPVWVVRVGPEEDEVPVGAEERLVVVVRVVRERCEVWCAGAAITIGGGTAVLRAEGTAAATVGCEAATVGTTVVG